VAGHETAVRREGGAGLEVWAHGGRDDAGANWIDDGGEAWGALGRRLLSSWLAESSGKTDDDNDGAAWR
jgi:hypothetical protein